MKVYQFDNLNKIFQAEKDALLDPIYKKPLIPRNATTKPPLPEKVGFARCFRNGEWVYLEDNRGAVWDIRTKAVSENKDFGPLPDIFTKKEPREFDEWNADKEEWLGHEENKKKSQYIRDRLEEYPAIGDQLDMLYWDKVNNTDKWRDLIKGIKQKYPKPKE